MKTVLLLIDIQNDYFPGGKAVLHEAEKTAENAQRVLDYFRENELPVIHVQHINKRDGASFFLPDTVGSEIHELVKPLSPEPIVIKHHPNSFNQTELFTLLTDVAADHIVVAGMMSHMCIDTTVRHAKDLGYSVTLLDDACTTKDLYYNGEIIAATLVHKSFMAALTPLFAKVCTTTEFLRLQN